jgi:hypothetical protein
LLYDELLVFEPTDVVRLNRAVALAEIGALHEALELIAALEPDLSDYQPLYAAKAELLYRAGTSARRTPPMRRQSHWHRRKQTGCFWNTGQGGVSGSSHDQMISVSFAKRYLKEFCHNDDDLVFAKGGKATQRN